MTEQLELQEIFPEYPLREYPKMRTWFVNLERYLDGKTVRLVVEAWNKDQRRILDSSCSWYRMDKDDFRAVVYSDEFVYDDDDENEELREMMVWNALEKVCASGWHMAESDPSITFPVDRASKPQYQETEGWTKEIAPKEAELFYTRYPEAFNAYTEEQEAKKG